MIASRPPFALLAAIALAAGTARGADAPAVPWAGSSIAYEHSGTAISLLVGNDPTWNPYYAHSLSFRPQWKFASGVTTRLSFDFAQELTFPDSTNDYFVWSDLVADVVLPSWTEPATQLRFAGDVRLNAPVSKVSRATSLLASVAPSASVSRKFEPLGLSARYSVRYQQNFHEYTTSQYDGPTIACVGDAEQCGQFMHTGRRNVQWSISHGPALSLSPLPKLTVSVAAALYRSALYDVAPAEVEADTGTFVVPEAADAVHARHAALFSVDASYELSRLFSVSLGAATLASQTGLDGQYRNPLVNRFTSLQLGLAVDVESLLARPAAPQP